MTKQELKELLIPEFLFTLHTAVECPGEGWVPGRGKIKMKDRDT